MYGDRRGGSGGGRGFGGNRGGPSRGGGRSSGGGFGGGFSRGPREMHTVTCSDCGQETQVPFKPAEGRPVYCRECYQKHKGDRFEDRPAAPKRHEEEESEAEPEYQDTENFGEESEEDK